MKDSTLDRERLSRSRRMPTSRLLTILPLVLAVAGVRYWMRWMPPKLQLSFIQPGR